MKQQLSSTKGQVITLDFIVAILLFTIAILISFKLIFNTEDSTDYNLLLLEARAISDGLLTEGVPNNWNSSQVIIPGIITQGQIDVNKLKELRLLGYEKTIAAYHARKNFYFYFTNSTNIVNISACGFGRMNQSCNFVPEIESRNIVRLDRLVVYENKPVRMVMLVWD